MFSKLHAKLGDFWWYSAMLFIACRSGDAIQAFIGLWLVPNYVGTDELGAVMPLQNLTGFFTAPLAVFATVFAKYINSYAVSGELGKIKSFIRDTILAILVLMIICALIAALFSQFFYERLRITNGLLTTIILIAGISSNISQLFNNALQGLKKFRTLAVINLIGAPVRLVTLLIAMPFRALTGYITGQATPPIFASITAFISLRTDFKNVKTNTSWRGDIPAMLKYTFPVALWTVGCIVYSTVFTTFIRQRLPELESSAYYMLSKLAEVGGYLGMTISIVLFPMAAEAHQKGSEKQSILKHSILGAIAFALAVAICFSIIGRFIFDFFSVWRPYIDYVGLLPPTTITMGVSCATGACVTYEMACRRFSPIWVVLGTNAAWLFFLITFAGHAFFQGLLPDWLIDFMRNQQINTLHNLIWVGLWFTVIQFFLTGYATFRKRSL